VENRRRRAAIDASSAILLYKAALFEATASAYSLILAPAVYGEIPPPGYPGSSHFSAALRSGTVEVVDPGAVRGEHVPAAALGEGESGTIGLFSAGVAEFVILDDGPAASYCAREGVPYVNALLVPRLLHFLGRLDDGEREKKVGEITMIGRYSRRIIDFARRCGREDLAPFL